MGGPNEDDAHTPPRVFLDAERLDVYQLALAIEPQVAKVARRLPTALQDQLDRASVSIVLNLAEGTGRRSPAEKARFYSIARGSATECAAIIDVAAGRGFVDTEVRDLLRDRLLRVVQMTVRLEQAALRRSGGRW